MDIDEIRDLMRSTAPVIKELVNREIAPMVKRLEALEQRLEAEKAMTKPRVRVPAGRVLEED